MSVPVFFRPRASGEIHEIQAWYEKREEGLGARFSRSLDLVVELIGEHPLACPVAYRTIRRALVPGFPYAVFYLFQSERVRVLACLHQRRQPAAVRKRLRSSTR